MKLYLARHGEYLANDIIQGEVLSEKGINTIKRMAEFIKSAHLSVNIIYHSHKIRAQQTAALLAEGFQCSQIIKQDGLQPLDDVSKIAQNLITSEENILIVGHLPFMSRLVNQLLKVREDKEMISFLPGTIVCFKREDDHWMIEWVLNPNLFG